MHTEYACTRQVNSLKIANSKKVQRSRRVICSCTQNWTPFLIVHQNLKKLWFSGLDEGPMPPLGTKKVKVAHTRLPSVGFRSWSRFLAVSLQVTRVINPAVGCHYFPPGLQLPSQPWRGLLPILLLCEERRNGREQFMNSLPKTVIRLRRGCDLNSGPTAPESSRLTTRPPSHSP